MCCRFRSVCKVFHIQLKLSSKKNSTYNKMDFWTEKFLISWYLMAKIQAAVSYKLVPYMRVLTVTQQDAWD